jgi:tRNA(Arg) A34 adenosine deaminase TadA
MMEIQKNYMQEAIKLAMENVEDNNGGPFGAVVVKDGIVVGRGRNRVTSANDPTAHAEIVAIREACTNLKTFDLEGCELYASCEPCPMCLGAIYWANISSLYYAATKDDAAKSEFNDADIYHEISLPKEQRKLPATQLMREDSLKVFEKWVNSDKKIPY